MLTAKTVSHPLLYEIARFCEFDRRSRIETRPIEENSSTALPVFVNEFWSARQRQTHSLHEIPYRACFKAELPRFFISRLSRPGDIVLDPFGGRGTTLLESAFLGRVPYGSDINPLFRHLVVPRLSPPSIEAVAARLQVIPWNAPVALEEDLQTFYHPGTLVELTNLREYLAEPGDEVDDWIRMVALTRLTGHSRGFFSVYTLPPNQAVSLAAQRKINRVRRQCPDYRNVPDLILRKTRSLLRQLTKEECRNLESVKRRACIMVGDARELSEIPDGSVQLTVCSPPFLDVVDYPQDNWLRLWFTHLPAEIPGISILKSPTEWESFMEAVLRTLLRKTHPGGYCVIEVGEVSRGRIHLENLVLPAGTRAGFKPLCILVNDQNFTKTANCWGVKNGKAGTNSNRMILFQKPS